MFVLRRKSNNTLLFSGSDVPYMWQDRDLLPSSAAAKVAKLISVKECLRITMEQTN